MASARTLRGERLHRKVAIAVPLALFVALGGCALEVKKPWPDGVDPCDPNPCTKSGACEKWVGTCAASDDGAGYTCSDWKPDGTAPNGPDGKPLTKPDKFEAQEISCDGVDNDCDGETDEGLLGNPLKDCAGKGICAGATVHIACVGGAWKCDWSVLPGYEASETTCDGKDNDCDGQTDETVSPGPHECRRAGLCAGLPPATCAGGKWDCQYGKATGYEADETSCDGVDNDCDGKVDVGLSLKALAGGGACPTGGVCSGGVTIACVGGVPTCDFAGISGYETVETACDGKDNDCDGATDNLAGTSAPLADNKTSGCKSAGVCGVGSTSITRTCAGGQWACSYAAVAYYEAKETLCDGRDNDCDGTTDGAIGAPKTSPCPSKGVCAGAAAGCSEGLWGCDFGALAAKGYEAFEATCDGKDNDCDGQTDEDPTPEANGCKTVGVCAVGVPVKCDAGKATCDYAAVPLAEPGSETSCDGLDNDCDGLTDEGGLDDSTSGCAKGVCAGKAKAICSAGKWQCDVSAVADFQAQELACDGKDNDCDGQTDEPEHLDLSATSCALSLGVCGAEKKLSCESGKAVCSYGANYEQKESKCDGKDNDCDGQTDFRLCKSGQACSEDSWCDKGSCADVRGGSGKQCTDKFGQCLDADGQGKVTATDNGSAMCSNPSSLIGCTAGKWGAPQACPSKTPACHKGKCLLCVPGAKTCDTTNVADVLQCDATGSKAAKLNTCASGKCVGAGLCVKSGVITISDSTKQISDLNAAAIGTGGFVATWISLEPFGSTIKARIFDAEGSADATVKDSFDVSDNTSYANNASNVAVAGNGGLYAIAWSVGDSAHARVYGAADHKPLGKVVVKAADTTDATRVAITAQGSGFVVAWSASVSGSNDVGIFMQRVDSKGQANGGVIKVANQFAGRADTAPALAATSDGGWILAWASVTSFGGVNAQVYGLAYDKDGKATSSQVLLQGTTVGGSVPALAVSGSTLFAAWRSTDNGGDVQFGTWDLALKPKKAATTAHTNTAGTQARPRLAADTTGGVLLAFESTDVGTGTGADVAVVVVGGDGTVAGKEALGGGDGKNLQDRPGTVAFSDTRALVLWRHRDSTSANGVVQAQFR